MGSHKKGSTSKSRLSKVGGGNAGAGNKKKGETEDIGTSEDEHPYRLGSMVVVNLEGEGEKLANIIERCQIDTEDEELDPACRYICTENFIHVVGGAAVVVRLGLAVYVH